MRDNRLDMKDKWADQLLQRFRNRQPLSKEQLFKDHFEPLGLSKEDVLECFDEIEFNYEIPVGLLRPDDKITKLTEGAETTNPLTWLFWRSRSEFREAELLDELNERLKLHGTAQDWTTIETFEEFVLAWCGKNKAHKP
jgi:hypothetical protein